LSEKKDDRDEDDGSNLLNKLTNLHPSTYNEATDPQGFEEWINDMEKLFDTFQCLDKWRVRFDAFYLKVKADLWWTTVKEKQNEPKFGWHNSRSF